MGMVKLKGQRKERGKWAEFIGIFMDMIKIDTNI